MGPRQQRSTCDHKEMTLTSLLECDPKGERQGNRKEDSAGPVGKSGGLYSLPQATPGLRAAP